MGSCRTPRNWLSSRVSQGLLTAALLALSQLLPSAAQAQEGTTDSDEHGLILIEDNPRLAVQRCQNFLKTFPSSSWRWSVMYELGRRQRQLGRHDDAIKTLQTFLLQPRLSDWARYRDQVELELAHCHVAQGRFEAAAKMFQAAEKHTICGSCATCYWGDVSSRRLWQGYCYERLGQFNKAARLYWDYVRNNEPYAQEINWRLVELYMAAGRRAQLVRLMDQLDADSIQRLEQQGMARKDVEGFPATDRMRELVALHDAAQQAQWAPIVTALLNADHSSPLEWQSRLSSHAAITAVALAAGQPQQTVPLLVKEIRLRAPLPMDDDPTPMADEPFGQAPPAARLNGNVDWLRYALGRCGTPAALDALETELRGETNYHRLSILAYSLSIAGEAGQRRLQEAAAVDEKLAGLIEDWRKGDLGEPDAMSFPIPAKGTALPMQLPRRAKPAVRKYNPKNSAPPNIVGSSEGSPRSPATLLLAKHD